MGAGRLVRRAVKVAAAGVLHYSGLRKAMAVYRRGQSGGRRILIVSYHRVVSDFTGELQRSIPGLLISQETFRRHLEEAAAAGYEFATIGDAVDVMAGRKVAKKDLCVVTFDDGYRDVYRYAYPLLKRMGVPAITYLPTDFIGTNRRFNHDRLFHLVRKARQRRLRPYFCDAACAGGGAAGAGPGGAEDAVGGAGRLHRRAPRQRAAWRSSRRSSRSWESGRSCCPSRATSWTGTRCARMARDGFEFGAHTLGHTVLTLEPPERGGAGDRRVQAHHRARGEHSGEGLRVLQRLVLGRDHPRAAGATGSARE